MKLLLLAGAALLFLLRGRGQAPTRTPWTNAGLPTPVAAPPELRTLATELAAALRARAPTAAGLVRQFQRRAGLVAVRDESGIATASGVYDALTRQAVGWYGQMWKEETP